MGKVLLAIVLLLGGCVSKKPVPKVNLELREVGDSLRVNYKIMVTKDGKSSYPVSNKVLMTGENIDKAYSQKNDSGAYDVVIHFDSEGAKEFARITEFLVGKKVAIIVGDELMSAPRINEAITGGVAQITGDFSKEEAEKLARGLAPQE